MITTIQVSQSLSSGIKCPHCGDIAYEKNYQTATLPDPNYRNFLRDLNAPFEQGKLLLCPVCCKITVIIDDKIVYPNKLMITPSKDMPEDIKSIFYEALSIATKSPRAACALLRLCIDKLAIHLGAKEDKPLAEKIKQISNIPDIANLLEACRLAGNKAVHPYSVDIEENDVELVESLADFINYIVNIKITMQNEAKKITERFNKKNHTN